MKYLAPAMLTLAVISAGSAPATAQNQRANFDTGNGYYAQCNEQASMFITGVCYGHLNGAIDAAHFFMDDKPGYCLPNSSTNKQAFDIMISYLRNNPSKRHLPTTLLVSFALADAFPCGK